MGNPFAQNSVPVYGWWQKPRADDPFDTCEPSAAGSLIQKKLAKPCCRGFAIQLVNPPEPLRKKIFDICIRGTSCRMGWRVTESVALGSLFGKESFFHSEMSKGLEKRVPDRMITFLRALIIAICVYAVLSGKPPAKAQSAEDAVQDANISALNHHLEATDSTVVTLSRDQQITSSIVSEMQGEQRVFFTILGLITSGSIVLQAKRKQP